MLNLPEDAEAQLARLKAQPKFQGDPNGLYTGVHDELARERAEFVVNELIQSIKDGLMAHPTKQFILDQFSIALKKIDLSDTEDREQVCLYLQQIMDCVGLESSDGLLNKWLYGFDPNDFKP